MGTAELPDLRRRLIGIVDHEVSDVVLSAFYEVYNTLGYGFLEAVYRGALAHELRGRGREVLTEFPVPVLFKGVVVGQYRLDLLVEKRIAVEVKSTELLHPTAKRQLINYLRASTIDIGLLLHFGPEPRFARVVSPRVIDRDAARSDPAVL